LTTKGKEEARFAEETRLEKSKSIFVGGPGLSSENKRVQQYIRKKGKNAEEGLTQETLSWGTKSEAIG